MVLKARHKRFALIAMGLLFDWVSGGFGVKCPQ